MVKRLWAVALLLLVVSPVTAPFQTFALPALSLHAVAQDSDDTGIVPLTTEPSRVMAAAPLWVVTHLPSVALPTVTSAYRSVPPVSPVASPSILSTILRV